MAKIKVKQVRSSIKRLQNQKRTLEALMLRTVDFIFPIECVLMFNTTKMILDFLSLMLLALLGAGWQNHFELLSLRTVQQQIDVLRRQVFKRDVEIQPVLCGQAV